MWFKNIQIFHLDEAIPYEPEAFSEALSALTFQPCGKVTPQTQGFAAPVGGGEEAPLVYGSNGFMIFCLKIEEKILPAAALRERHLERVQEIEQAQGQKLYKNDKARLKDEIYHTMLAQAFTKSTKLYAYIDTRNNWLIVDSSSNKRIDLMLGALNQCTDIKINNPERVSPSALMSRWLKKHRYPANLSILDHCVIQDTNDERGIARFSHKDLLGESVQTLLRDGSQVIQLGLNWADQLRFTLKEDFTITSVKYSDAVTDLAKDGLTETPEEHFAADFVIMAQTIGQFLTDLLPVFSEEKVAAQMA